MISEYIISAFFIISIALAAVGILVSLSLKSRYNLSLFSTLVFYVVFYFIFGFYGIWGNLLTKGIFETMINESQYAILSNITLFGSWPFLVLAWMMLLVFTFEITNRETRRFFYYIFLILNLALLPLVGYAVSIYPSLDVFVVFKALFAASTILYSGSVVLLQLLERNKSKILSKRSVLMLTIGQLTILITLSASALFVDYHLIVTIIFIVIYFLGGAFLPLFIKYKADLSALILQDSSDQNFEVFCSKYDISNREKEIILAICNGLSNQEVADKLFISLQTVKGHTSRIYMKTNIRSRAQLIAIVNSIRN